MIAGLSQTIHETPPDWVLLGLFAVVPMLAVTVLLLVFGRDDAGLLALKATVAYVAVYALVATITFLVLAVT